MDKVVGKVEVIAPNKVGFQNFKVGNDWYSTGSKTPPAFSRGDEVSFDVEVTEKGFKNAKNIVASAVKTASPTYSTSAPKTVGAAPAVDWDLKDRKIQQQSARNAAIAFMTLLGTQGAIKYKANAQEKDKVVVLEAMLEHYTEQFLSATADVGQTQTSDSQASDLSGEES